MRTQIEIFKLLVISFATITVGACVSLPTPSLPPPPSMPSSAPPPSPSSSPPSSPSSSPPSSPSSSPSSSSGSPSQSSGAPSQPSGSQGSPSGPPPGSQGGEQSADGGSPATPGEGQPAAGGGEPTDLDILEPEPVTNTADASDSMEESAESGGGESGGGEEGGGEQGGGEEGGGEQGGGEQGGGEEGGGAQGGGSQGGGSQGGSLDDELMASVEGFEDGMQQQILIIASASPADGMDDASQQIEGAGDPASGGSESLDQTGGGAPGLIMIEGDVSQLPQGGGQTGGPTNSSGVINVNDQGNMGERQNREGDSQVARILVANIPPDIGDGSDDDVVARQIREAAMNEEDPVLREKLWQEYRNYVKSLGRKKF